LPPDIAAELDVSAPEIIKDSFVDAELQPHLSDLLYQVGVKGGGSAYVYLLFEHKSAPDGWVGLQLLRYQARIWEQAWREQVSKLPPIFPLVLYHGRTAWPVERRFGALIDWEKGAALRRYVPEFEYHLVDLSVFNEAEIKGEVFLRVGLLLLKYIFSTGLLPRLPSTLALLPLPEQSALEYLRTVLYYLSKGTGKITESQFAGALKQAFPQEGEGIMQTMIDVWIQQGVEKGLQQGWQAGKQEGRQEGRQEGSAALTLRLLKRRIGVVNSETQARVRALSFEQLEQLGEALLDFQQDTDLQVWLETYA
jgi:predicted transposase/invertase (TIGR01784 family)